MCVCAHLGGGFVDYKPCRRPTWEWCYYQKEKKNAWTTHTHIIGVCVWMSVYVCVCVCVCVCAFGEAIALRVGPQDSATCTKQLFHRVAMALWRGNATLWLHRQPSLSPPLWTVYCSACVCIFLESWKILFKKSCVCVCVRLLPIRNSQPLHTPVNRERVCYVAIVEPVARSTHLRDVHVCVHVCVCQCKLQDIVAKAKHRIMHYKTMDQSIIFGLWPIWVTQ